jgi:hypothetical protein
VMRTFPVERATRPATLNAAANGLCTRITGQAQPSLLHSGSRPRPYGLTAR